MVRHLLRLIIIGTIAVATAHAETLQEFAAKCDEAMGGSFVLDLTPDAMEARRAVTVPAFKCDDERSTEVPITNAFDRNGKRIALEYQQDQYGNLALKNADFPQLYARLQKIVRSNNNISVGTCDRPDVLNGECDPGSRFRVLFNTPEAFAVAHCRKKGNPENQWGDIAVIQHNKKTGATCFYQEGPRPGLKNDVLAPSDPKSVHVHNDASTGDWESPVSTAGSCLGCHDNGPIIRSPYLAQIKGPDTVKLPGAGDFSFNKAPNAYSFVGSDFASWKAYKVEITALAPCVDDVTKDCFNSCNQCHRMGVNNLGSGGTARNFGLLATQMQPQSAKNVHSETSPIWMKPGQTFFNKQTWEDAQAIAKCANTFDEHKLPNSKTCKITPFADAYTLDPATLIEVIRIPMR